MRSIRLLLTLALASAAHAISAAVPRIPVENFFKDPEFTEVALSPKGTYLAVSVPRADRTILAILRTEDMSVQSTFDYGANRHIDNVAWVSDERFIMALFEQTGRFDARTPRSMHAANVDGRRRVDIPNGFSFQLVSTLPEDDRDILAARSIDGAFLYRIDTVTGDQRVVATAPLDMGTFAVDRAGNVRYSFGQNDDLTSQTFRRKGNEWELIHSASYRDGGSRVPLGVNDDGSKVIMSISDTGEPARVALVDPTTGEEEILARNPRVDPLGLTYSADGRQVIAVPFMDGMPEYAWVDAAHPDTKLLAGLVKAFPNLAVTISDLSEDGRLALVLAYSDTDPGSYYLFDRTTGEARFLLSAMEWIKPDQMSPMKPIKITARDGLELHGYLTIPRGSDGKNLPLILHPHGGPHGPRDEWGFNPEVQFLANRGYAVMQINFRGSGGYGKAFEAKGYRNWGLTMIDDMTDAMRWAVSQGIADPERLCTYGASYGGYAALQSVVREPEKYSCAIGYVGLYNMDLWLKDSDVAERRSGRNYQSEVFPPTSAERQAQSPAFFIDRINVPLMLVHGEMDMRVPISQFRDFTRRLDEAGKPPEVVVVEEKEGHGFYNLDNQVDLYNAMERFLDSHIGDATQRAD
jgi:dipeptidyl aminopeptidase/acylaminoacyl peptidase